MGFKINQNTIKIEAGNEVFEADPAIAEIYVNAARKEILQFNNKMVAGDASEKDVEDTIKKTAESIEKVLGKGSVNKIFGDKAVSLHDIIDLNMYILSVTESFEGKKASEYKRMSENPFNK